MVNRLLATNQQLQHEIQERKAVEHSLLLAQQELNTTQKILQQIVDNYPDGSISVVDKDLNYIFTGGEIHKTLGNDENSMIGTRLFPLISDNTWQKFNATY
ncbi:MAG: hypothetical protein HC817_02750 [Saprospiraceae bacterium]|nr:hypothetical protein [Saprospiraceae bacterium]